MLLPWGLTPLPNLEAVCGVTAVSPLNSASAASILAGMGGGSEEERRQRRADKHTARAAAADKARARAAAQAGAGLKRQRKRRRRASLAAAAAASASSSAAFLEATTGVSEEGGQSGEKAIPIESIADGAGSEGEGEGEEGGEEEVEEGEGLPATVHTAASASPVRSAVASVVAFADFQPSSTPASRAAASNALRAGLQVS